MDRITRQKMPSMQSSCRSQDIRGIICSWASEWGDTTLDTGENQVNPTPFLTAEL